MDRQKIVFAVIAIVLIYMLFLKNCNSSENFNPALYYPVIQKEADRDGIVRLPEDAKYPWSTNTGNYGETEYLDDGANGKMGLNFNMCSKSCCSQQWPVPFSLEPDQYVKLSGEEFVPSSYTCNNGWQDSGCVCMTKDQSLHLNRRGNNSYKEV